MGDQAAKLEDHVMRRILIVSAVMLALLTTLVPPASASDAVGCRRQRAHRAICWNHKRYSVFFGTTIHFYNGTWKTYWFKLNPDDRWAKHTTLSIKSVTYQWSRL
jgi:hypothetical protein